MMSWHKPTLTKTIKAGTAGAKTPALLISSLSTHTTHPTPTTKTNKHQPRSATDSLQLHPLQTTLATMENSSRVQITPATGAPTTPATRNASTSLTHAVEKFLQFTPTQKLDIANQHKELKSAEEIAKLLNLHQGAVKLMIAQIEIKRQYGDDAEDFDITQGTLIPSHFILMDTAHVKLSRWRIGKDQGDQGR